MMRSNARKRKTVSLAWPSLRFFTRWVEPELFRPYLFFSLFAITCSEFVRGSLTLSILPTYGRTVLGFAVEWTGIALSIHYLVDNLLRIPVGWVIDKMGSRYVLIGGFCIGIISMFWMMNVHHIWSLIASMALFGVAATPMWPSAISAISKSTPEAKRAAFMGYLYIFWLTGTGLGPVIINFLWSATYHLAFVVLLCLLSLGLILVFLFVRIPANMMRQTADFRKGDQHPSVHKLRMNKGDLQSLLQNLRGVVFLLPGMFVQTFAVSCLVPILSLYAKVILHLTGPMYSLLLTCFGALTIIGLIPAGKLVVRYGSRRFLIIGFLFGGAALGLYPFFKSLLTTYIVVGLFGITYAFILPAWNSILDRSIDADKKATLWGVFMTVDGLGSAAGAFSGGFVWDAISPEAPFFLAGIIILGMGVLYGLIPLERRRIT